MNSKNSISPSKQKSFAGSVSNKQNFNTNEIYYTKALKPLDFSFKDLNNFIDLLTANPRRGIKKQQEQIQTEEENKNLTNKMDTEDKLESKKKKKTETQQEVIVEGKIFGGGTGDAYKNKKRKESQLIANPDSGIRQEKKSEKSIKFLPYTNSIILHSNNITSLEKIDFILEEILPEVDFLNERYAKYIFSSGQLSFINYNKVDLLQWIDLSHNKIKNIHIDITKLKYLKILYLHANYIQKLEEVSLLAKCNSLINLTLHGNPIEHIKGYRLLVIELLPALEKLDFTLVSEKELDIIHFKGARFGEKRNKKTGKVVIFPKLDQEILNRMNIPSVNDKKEI